MSVILNVILSLLLSCWFFPLALGCGVLFFGRTQYSPADGCSVVSLNFGVLAGEDERTPFHSAIIFSFVLFFCVFLPPLLNTSCFCQVHPDSVLHCAHLCMKCSTGISNFIEEISGLSHSIVFIFFFLFALITQEVFLISPCYSLELYTQMSISFLFSFAFLILMMALNEVH